MKSLDEKFPSKDEKEQTKNYLKTLLNSEGWKILANYLEDDIKSIDCELRIKKFNNVADIEVLQKDRANKVILKILPEKLIEELSGEKQKEPDYDPY